MAIRGVVWQKLLRRDLWVWLKGIGHPTLNRNPYNGYVNPYYWVDDNPLFYGNNGSSDFHSLKLTAGTSKWMVGQKERIVIQLPMAPFFRDYNHMAYVLPRKLGKWSTQFNWVGNHQLDNVIGFMYANATLLETNSSHLKMSPWKRNTSISHQFRVSMLVFRGCIFTVPDPMGNHHLSPSFGRICFLF